MNKWVKFGAPVLVVLLITSIFKYKHDYRQALLMNNANVLFTSAYLRLEENPKIARSFYREQLVQNKENASMFANGNIGHMGSLFKDWTRFSKRENDLARSTLAIDGEAFQAWHKVDPEKRDEIYARVENILSKKKMFAAVLATYTRPDTYGSRYEEGEYAIDDVDTNDPDSLANRIEEMTTRIDEAKEIKNESSRKMKKNEKKTGNQSDVSETATKSVINYDEVFQRQLGNIANELTKQYLVQYHAGGQSAPKMPSEYAPGTETYHVTFTPTSGSAGVTNTGTQAESFDVDFVFDSDKTSFVISNLDQLPANFKNY